MEAFLAQLRKNNIYLSLKDGDLSVKYLSKEIDTSLLEEIKTNKEVLVGYLSSLNKNDFSRIIPVADSVDYPLSSAQKRLWILSQFEEGNIAYNVPIICTFQGELNLDALEMAFRALITRHEILRTVFRQNKDGEVRQYIKTVQETSFSIDYNFLKDETLAKDIINEIITTPFVLTEGPLLSAHLLQVEDDKCIFACIMHHIISDGWSTGVMMKELLTLYNAFTEGSKNPLPPLKIQYKDYAAWQYDQLSGEKLLAHQRYWLNQFEGDLPILDFPSDRVRPAVKTYNGAVINKELSGTLLVKLKDIIQSEGSTLFMGLVSLVNALLYRYTSQQDIVIGSPIAGRDHVDLEDQIGFYVNMLALRTRFNENDSYRSLLKNVKQVTLGAYEHQVYPFDALVNEVHLSGDTSRHALFDVVLVLQNTAQDEQEESFGNVSVSPYTGKERVVSLFDMRLDFRETADALLFMVEYNIDIYDRERIDRFGDNLIRLLEAIVEQPDLPIHQLDYISPMEKLLLLQNDAVGNYPEAKTIVDLFEQQVSSTPDNIAVVLNAERISYHELNERANRMAHFLITETGLKPDDCVAILLNRTPDCIAAMLGILKAGAAYVPMEPDLPEERLKFMIRDADIKVLITEKIFLETVNRLQWSCNSLKSYLCVDSADVYSEKEQVENVMMDQELWDHVGEKAVDQVTGGGWGDSFTGKPIPAEQMEEYAMNVYLKVAPLLHKEMRVLEIGCSSGLTLNKVAPEVGLYYGTDLSPVILENTAKMITAAGLSNVKLKNIVAHDIAKIEEADFDLVIINSVIQHFHGHNYLRNVIKEVSGLLKDTGRIFIGDIMDADKKEMLINDLVEFKVINKDKGYKTKTDFSADLFVAKGFFKDLMLDEDIITDVAISDKIFTMENELTKYRYDVFLSINKQHKTSVKSKRYKNQFSNSILAAQPVHSPALKLSPANLAYVIYTSGTTGQPKGVLVQHYNVVRLFLTDQPLFEFKETDVWTMFHSYSFDFSVWEMYGALFYGGRLVLIPKIVAQDAAAYLSLLNREQVTILNQTPSAFYNLSENALSTRNTTLNLRYIIFGGEALSPGKLKAWRSVYPFTRLINMYGITETTVHVTYKEIRTKEIDNNISNIGKPIPTLSCYVLDQHGNLLPLGVPGELYIGGAGVSRGYLNREELTAQRFLTSPFKEGDRLYRSGDKVKLLANGEMEYLGRMDHQVKIRGYRIELGEIEVILLKHEQVREVKVIAQEDRNDGNKYLAAYIVTDAALNLKELRDYLGAKLPEYMVPSYFVPLEQFPLTRNGKINIKLLPDPLQTSLESDTTYVAPATETEIRLAVIWTEILGRERIGIHDNFFELGGHSLKAMQLKIRIQKDLQIQIELRDIFGYTTIHTQAELIDSNEIYTYKAISKAAKQDSYPLSHSQRRFWALSQQKESALAYNMLGVLYLDGILNVTAMEQAIRHVILRHESLRTAFRENKEGEVRQYILEEKDIDFKINYIDISYSSDQEELLREIYKEEESTPFDLATELLIRVKLVRQKTDLHTIFYTMQHIICDGWSMEILAGEVTKAYNSYSRNITPELIPLKLQYNDYTTWQKDQLSGDVFRKDEDYWLQQFSGRLPVLEMPTDYSRPAVKSFKGAWLEKLLPDDVVKSLQSLCSKEGTTLFMGLLAAVNGVLYQYSGQEDIIIGAPLAGREHRELEDQIGLYLNTIALRTQFKGTDSFSGLLGRVREVMLNAYKHGSYPFDMLVEKLRIRNDMSRSILFDVWVVLQNQRSTNVGSSEQVLEGLRIRQFEGLDNDSNQFDLMFSFNEKGNNVELLLNYSTDLYKTETIEALYNHLIQFIRLVTTQPQLKLNQVNYISPEEQQTILDVFNHTQQVFPAKTSVLQLFEEQVRRSPDSIAIVFEDKELTYHELNAAANRLAHYLKETGHLQPGDLAGIIMDRSEKLIIAILGVLKSGAAYVPIEPAYPEERLQYILDDTKAKIILTAAYYDIAISESVNENEPVQAIIKGSESFDENKPVINGTDLAYIIYTSGSTGVPKGCMITHHNLLNYIQWANEYYFDDSEYGNWALITAVSFDLTVTSIFTSLTRGKRLHIGSADQDIAQLLSACFKDKRIDTLKLTPSHISLLKGLHLDTTAIRKIICGGEQLTLDQVAIIRGIDDRIELYNEYGPTETTVGCIVKKIESEEERIVIGTPAANTEIYIMNENRLLCPVGIPGEIYIGGVGVGRGYWGKPELTALQFIDNPFRPGEKIYKTGDLGRWLPDGNIIFSGRKDDQVKIRGYRIELDEIAHMLRGYPSISDAIVLAMESRTVADKYLVAYFVSDETPDQEELTAYLKHSLPAYMIPAYFMQLDYLPLTVNGKVDKNRLPDPVKKSLSDNVYLAPRNETEEVLVKIWEEVLGREGVGINDDFFELGLSSLNIMQLNAGIKKKFGTEIGLMDMFEYPTISQIAEKKFIDKRTIDIPAKLQVFDGRIDPARKNVFFIPPSSGISYWYLSLLKEMKEDINGFLLNLRGIFDEEGPYASMEEVIEDFLQSIVQFSSLDQPVSLLGYSSGGPLIAEIGRQLELRGYKVILFILDAVPKTIHEELIRDKETFVSSIFSDLEHFRKLAASIHADEQALQNFLDMAFNFHCLWPDYEQPAANIKADTYVFINHLYSDNLAPYLKWRDFIKGDLQYITLEEGEHTVLLQYPANIELIKSVMLEAFR